MSNKAIFCLVGASGVGKTTVCNRLVQEYGLKAVESYTTRPPRYPGETGHIFVTPEEFHKLGPLCAYTKFDGHEYGVPSSMVDACDLYVIDPPGVRYLKEHYSGKQVYVIGFGVDEHTLLARILHRGDTKEEAMRRLNHDREQFDGMRSMCDILIPAYDLEETISDVVDFMQRVDV